MRTFRQDKLVKDKVFNSMQELGQKPKYRILDGDELAKELRKKIIEEALEYAEAGDEGELRDLLGAVQAHLNVGETNSKIELNGQLLPDEFTRRIFIETITLADDDTWLEYYLVHPDRYPEVVEK